jgi:6-phosphogluconolactonase
MNPNIEAYPGRDLASIRAAEMLAAALRNTLDKHHNATMAVCGGTTPQVCFQHLAQADLPWHRVLITLTDERCVPSEHRDSNERMVRSYLLQGPAAQAHFVPMQQIENTPFSAVLVGMGADGHFASLFPDATNLGTGLDPKNPNPTIDIITEASPHPRMSMTLSRLLRTKHLLLLAFGEDKRGILEQPRGYPVAHLFQHQANSPTDDQPTTLSVLWAK